MGDRVCGPAERALSEFSTAELLDELAARKGVRASHAAAGACLAVDTRGPATVIVVRHGRPLAGRPWPPREG